MLNTIMDILNLIVPMALYVCLTIATCQIAAKKGRIKFFIKFFLPFIGSGLLILMINKYWLIKLSPDLTDTWGMMVFYSIIFGYFLIFLPVALGTWMYVLPELRNNRRN